MHCKIGLDKQWTLKKMLKGLLIAQLEQITKLSLPGLLVPTHGNKVALSLIQTRRRRGRLFEASLPS